MYKNQIIINIYFCSKVEEKMGENSHDAIEGKLEELRIKDTDITWSAKVRGRKKNSSEPSGSVKDSFVDTGFSDVDIESKLSELQCPFSWPIPRCGIIPSEKILSLTEKDKELEDDDFKIRK